MSSHSLQQLILGDLPLAWRFYAGVVWIVTLLVIGLACWQFVPELLRESLAWCRETFRKDAPANSNVIDIAEGRRRQQLDAAAGRRAS